MVESNEVRDSRLDRAGRALLIVGALVLGPLAVLLVLFVAWFISYFGDGSAERGLAAMTDVWPVWLVALAVIAVVVAALVWMIRGGRVALTLAAVSGLAFGAAGLWMLGTGHDDGIRWTLIRVGVLGGLALTSGAAVRLTALYHRGA